MLLLFSNWLYIYTYVTLGFVDVRVCTDFGWPKPDMVELPLCLGCGKKIRGPIWNPESFLFCPGLFLQFPHVEKGYLRWCFLIFWGGPKPSNPILIAFESHVTNVNPYFWLTSKMNKSRTPKKLMMKTMKTMISSGQTWSHHFFWMARLTPHFFHRVQDLRRRRKPCGASCNSCGRRVSIQTASCARLSSRYSIGQAWKNTTSSD